MVEQNTPWEHFWGLLYVLGGSLWRCHLAPSILPLSWLPSRSQEYKSDRFKLFGTCSSEFLVLHISSAMFHFLQLQETIKHGGSRDNATISTIRGQHYRSKQRQLRDTQEQMGFTGCLAFKMKRNRRFLVWKLDKSKLSLKERSCLLLHSSWIQGIWGFYISPQRQIYVTDLMCLVKVFAS